MTLDLIAEQRGERRLRILETARRLIEESGYDGVSMRALARHSRVSVPTLYKLFGDKGALLVEAVEAQFVELLNRIDREHVAEGLDLLLAIPDGCAREILRAPRYSRAVLSVFAGSGQTLGVGDAVARELTQEIEVALLAMRKSRQLAPWVDPRVVAERLCNHQMMVCLQWAGGHLSSDGLGAAMVYGTCLMVAGVARGAAARELLQHAERLQAAAAVAPPGSRRKSAAKAGARR